jgi:hypothetical protein
LPVHRRRGLRLAQPLERGAEQQRDIAMAGVVRRQRGQAVASRIDPPEIQQHRAPIELDRQQCRIDPGGPVETDQRRPRIARRPVDGREIVIGPAVVGKPGDSLPQSGHVRPSPAFRHSIRLAHGIRLAKLAAVSACG